MRNSRLRAQQLTLLQTLAGAAVETALPHHRLDAWFADHLCRSLVASGLLLVSDLQAKVRAGGRWWASIPRIGAGKAGRLAQHLDLLIPGSISQQRSDHLARRGRTLVASIRSAQPTAARSASPALPSPTSGQGAPGLAAAIGFDLTSGQPVDAGESPRGR